MGNILIWKKGKELDNKDKLFEGLMKTLQNTVLNINI